MWIIPVRPRTWHPKGQSEPGTNLLPLLCDRENAVLVDAPTGNTTALCRHGDTINMYGAIDIYTNYYEGTHLVRFEANEFPEFVHLRVANRQDYLPALIAARDAVMELIAANIQPPTCSKCAGKGWYFVDEWIGPLQGRRDCACVAVAQNTNPA
jgi:hypothetical protein